MSTLALYSPRLSPLHRTPAGVKLAALGALSVLLFAVPRLPVAPAALAVVVVLALGGARLTPRQLLAQLRPVWLWLVGLLAFHLVVTDLASGSLAVLRLAALVLAAAVVTATSKVADLVAVIEWLCAPLRLVGVRPGRIGLAIAMTLRFIPLVAERGARIREAQAARGATRPMFLMLVPLLVQVLQLAHTTAEALDARGADDEPPPRPLWRRS
ncbi:energy-coupling factor transporter transmembrane component T family protein [Modestobacter excelsi]|uniref:energy-coupling factor transporter transmembrane component T family protein n=1 Tax=Modestobacter excelsi TaxID=2213161 RepID=UPI00110C98A0|nr:energy-coupling factor transporter transmembrane protein EcfT [Modestobacter excelsi]